MAGDDDHYSTHRSRRDDRDASHRRTHGSDREHNRETSRRRSRSPSPHAQSRTLHPVLARFGVRELTPDDYYIRSAEFKAWLSETKSKYLDEISSQDARRYFERFVRRWNEGRLDDDFYTGKIRGASVASGSGTRHRWGFATASAAEKEQLAMVRDTVDTLTNGDSRGAAEARDAERRARHGRSMQSQSDAGPPLPTPPARDSGWTSRKSHAESQYDREHTQQLSRVAASETRRRARHDQADQDEALHGRATGRERALEKKRQLNTDNRDFANRRLNDDGIELDDRELYDDDSPALKAGGSGERRMGKREQSRQERLEERRAEMQEKVSAMKEKDSKTMEMLRALAQERFGGS
ncbi:hypothetical protein EX895_002557 [Sporisorium graminicola]|uniref:Splicing arginine serine-rich 12 n=1 Tax=Sporisorium graminicola TaxID=280036 RepID=A0A4U7KYR7_9BASI|nr:hypothetical protein EX895_002557 [Sporisorium graminicola]TKY88568.1 hypothetical protein EX895_002557 [Sporisorium graminicola]